MRTYLDGHEANARVEFTIRVHLTFEPGAWIVTHDGQPYSITAIQGVIAADGNVHLAFPKGVGLTRTGAWSAKEALLPQVLPRQTPHDTWLALPRQVRELLADTYLLARDDTPTVLGHTKETTP